MQKENRAMKNDMYDFSTDLRCKSLRRNNKQCSFRIYLLQGLEEMGAVNVGYEMYPRTNLKRQNPHARQARCITNT